jgi:hypothetical protein
VDVLYYAPIEQGFGVVVFGTAVWRHVWKWTVEFRVIAFAGNAPLGHRSERLRRRFLDAADAAAQVGELRLEIGVHPAMARSGVEIGSGGEAARISSR